jgi:hypothetical protein
MILCLVQAKEICSPKRHRLLTAIRGSVILLVADFEKGFRAETFRGPFFFCDCDPLRDPLTKVRALELALLSLIFVGGVEAVQLGNQEVSKPWSDPFVDGDEERLFV